MLVDGVCLSIMPQRSGYYSANIKGDIKQRIWLLDVERKN